MREYKPGDVIVKDQLNGKTIRLVVADPAYTARGKLRMLNENRRIQTAWWGRFAGDTWLPKHYRVESRS